MTATNIFVQRDRVSLVADGAFYDSEGFVRDIASKIAIAPQAFRMALAVSGHAFASQVADRLASAASQTEAMAMLPAVAQAMRAETQAAAPDATGHLIVAVAIWSDVTDRPEGWLISTDPNYVGVGYEAGRLVEVEQMVVPQFPMFAFDLERFHPIADGLHVLQAQRQVAHEDDGAYCVGGFGEVAIVSREGVERHRLVDWPDAIGRRVELA